MRTRIPRSTPLLVVLVGGCSLAPPSRTPEPVAVVPEAYQEADLDGAYEPIRWWTSFDDPVLDRLVQEALDDNLDLQEAVARLMEARAQARVAGADLWPGISASGQVSETSSPANTGSFRFFGGGQAEDGDGNGTDGDGTDGDAPSAPTRFSSTTYSAGLSLGYELDFWGRARNDARAASLDALAAAGDVQTARLGVIGDVVQTYFEVVDLRRRIRVTVALVNLLTERVALAEDRYARGLVSSFELLQIRQDFRNTQAALPLLEAQLAGAEGRLSVLLGDFSGGLEPGADTVLPRLELEPVPAGLPASLLVQRPDVRAAA
ncbi:MAG: TolC family protein, partial [Gemmatimonadota bacterium]